MMKKQQRAPFDNISIEQRDSRGLNGLAIGEM
jgi:hypothetical protein